MNCKRKDIVSIENKFSTFQQSIGVKICSRAEDFDSKKAKCQIIQYFDI